MKIHTGTPEKETYFKSLKDTALTLWLSRPDNLGHFRIQDQFSSVSEHFCVFHTVKDFKPLRFIPHLGFKKIKSRNLIILILLISHVMIKLHPSWVCYPSCDSAWLVAHIALATIYEKDHFFRSLLSHGSANN